MSHRKKFIQMLRRNDVGFKEVQTESGLALEIHSKSNRINVYTFVDDIECHLEIHVTPPVFHTKIQDVQTFINSRLQFKKNEIRWDINRHGIYRIESTIPGEFVGSFRIFNVKLAQLRTAIDRQSSYIEAIARGVKSIDQVIADFDLYTLKIT